MIYKLFKTVVAAYLQKPKFNKSMYTSKKMENNKNTPPVFPAYIVNDAILQGHILNQNIVVLINIYYALELGADPQVAVQPEPQR